MALKENERPGVRQTEQANMAWSVSQGMAWQFVQQLAQGGPYNPPVDHSRGKSSRSLP